MLTHLQNEAISDNIHRYGAPSVPDLDKIAKAFRLFNEKAGKLACLSFMQKMQDPNVGYKVTFTNLEEGGARVEQHRVGPDEEAMDAFVLTFRFFIQDNEQTSLRQMANHYADAPVDQALKDEFAKARDQINRFLDSPTHINYNNEVLTCRRIMDVFMYGGFSHANEDKRRLYKTWMNDPFVSQFIVHIFVSTLAYIQSGIAHIKGLNERALQHLPGPS